MIRISGCSDDTLVVEGPAAFVGGKNDHDTCARDGVHVEVAIGDVLIVRGFYGVPWNTLGLWTLGVEPMDEDRPVPWPVRVVTSARGYSMAIEVDCPEDTRVEVRESSVRIRGV